MVHDAQLPRPTEAELALLRALWERGPSTVRQMWERLDPAGRPGYTTVLKLLQIMHGKGLVERDDTERAHVYRARLTQDQTQSQLVGDLVDRAFKGSSARLVMQALSSRPASRTELEEIRKLLDTMEGDRR